MKEEYSHVFIEKMITSRDEIRFNCEEKGNSINLGKRFSEYNFTLRRGEKNSYSIINEGKNKIGVDSYWVEPGTEFKLSGESIFFYSANSIDVDNDGILEKEFLFGFDPGQFGDADMWQLEPEKNQGLSIKANNYTKLFKNRNGVNGLKNVNFTVHPSEFVGIYGNSGTGKTVLLESFLAPKAKASLFTRLKSVIKNFFANLFPLFFSQQVEISGSISFNGMNVSHYANEIAYLPQHVDLPEELTCYELLLLAMRDRGDKSALASPDDMIRNTLSLCSLNESILAQKSKSLSGGQRRRLVLAMALMKKKIRLLALDEPTTGLDIESELAIMRTLRRISRHGITVVVITHSVAALEMFDRVLVLRKNRLEGANLSFKSKWLSQSFEETDLFEMTNVERLTFLANQDSGLLLKETKDTEYIWPFVDQMIYEPPQNVSSKLKDTWQNIKKSTKEYWSETSLWQILSWMKVGSKLILKDIKSLGTFIVLAIFAVVVIHLGMCTPSNDGRFILGLLTICAPWLAATYAATFVSNLKKFYAWERFSGLRAQNFVMGVFGALVIPSFILGLVFTFGAFSRLKPQQLFEHCLTKIINNSEIDVQKFSSQQIVPRLDLNSQVITHIRRSIMSDREWQKYIDQVVSYSERQDILAMDFPLYDAQAEGTEISRIKISGSTKPLLINTTKTDWQGLKDTIDEGVEQEKKQDRFSNPLIKELLKADDDKTIVVDLSSQNAQTKRGVKFFFSDFIFVLTKMLFVCMIGCAIGIFSASKFKKNQSAILFIVVLFIYFLTFGPLFSAKESGQLVPLQHVDWQSFTERVYPTFHYGETPANALTILKYSEGEHIVPMLISFLSISRYTFNMICFEMSDANYDFYLLCAVTVLALIWSSFILGNKTKNWKELSR